MAIKKRIDEVYSDEKMMKAPRKRSGSKAKKMPPQDYALRRKMRYKT